MRSRTIPRACVLGVSRPPTPPAYPACRRCGRTDRPMMARQLDSACWMAAKKDGTLEDYPRRLRPAADTLAEYEHLTRCGESETAIAAKLGITVRGLRWALASARRRTANA